MHWGTEEQLVCRQLNAQQARGPGKRTPHRFKVEQKGNRSWLAEEEPPRLRGGRKTSRANEALRRHLWEGRPTEVHENKLPLLRESDSWGCVYKNRTHRGSEESDGLGWDWNHYLSNKRPSRRLHPWPGPKCTPGSGAQLSKVFCSLPEKFATWSRLFLNAG